MARKKLILLTNSEHGQANVFLAVAHSILELSPETEVHFVSFPYIKKFVLETSSHALAASPNASPIIFHPISGWDYKTAVVDGKIVDFEKLSLKPGFVNTPQTLRTIASLFQPYPIEKFIPIVRNIEKILRTIDTEHVIVDSTCSPALTALNKIGRKYNILAPNTIKDFGVGLWDSFFKYPCPSSGFPFPLPRSLLLVNAYFMTRLIGYIISASREDKLRKRLKEELGCELVLTGDVVMNKPEDINVIVANLPELEFQGLRVPKTILPVGPMIRPTPSVAELDPELGRWLARGPTVYINLGTHHVMTEQHAVELSGAIRALLDEASTVEGMKGLQVLWRLNRRSYMPYEVHEPGCKIHDILGVEFGSDKVRVVEWVKPEPSAVLATGHVICSVNHGGANSFLEAAAMGVPQVILPVWVDTYDFANRAEHLGIGRWGSKIAHPEWTTEELGGELVEVVLGKEAVKMRAKAKELAQLCSRKGEGRIRAARWILDTMV